VYKRCARDIAVGGMGQGGEGRGGEGRSVSTTLEHCKHHTTYDLSHPLSYLDYLRTGAAPSLSFPVCHELILPDQLGHVSCLYLQAPEAIKTESNLTIAMARLT
jgi:hypothetical protein